MGYKVILSPRAARDLEGIVRYISLDNPERALTFGRELIAKARSVGEFPEGGRQVPELDEPGIREVIHGAYRIVYRVNHQQQRIEISRFWHAARGYPRV